MTERRRRPDQDALHPDSPNLIGGADDLSTEEKMRQLSGDQLDEQTAYIDRSEVDDLGEFTSMEKYQGELEAGIDDDLPSDPEDLELLTERELRDGETEDVMEAVEEGYTYVPPVDPPVVPSEDRQDAEIADGFGLSALDDEPYDEDHHSTFLSEDDEMTARVREAIRADSATTHYANRVAIETRGGVVTLRGTVSDLEDSDNLVAAAGRVEDVIEVVDELNVRTMESEEGEG